MKFKLIKENCVNVNCYGKTASTGDVIFLDGWLADKASRNSDFQITDEPETKGPVKKVVKKVVKKAAKKKAK